MDYDLIGVVSNRCRNIGACAWGGLQDFWGISAYGRVWRAEKSIPNTDRTFTEKAHKDEIITAELDCGLSEISFRIEDKQLYGPMKLPPREAWYPAIQIAFSARKTSVIFIEMK